MGDLIVNYAMRFIGTPYLWGGDDPLTGYDCSGFALEILEAFGFKLSDTTAQGLYLWCLNSRFRSERRPGALAFFGKNGKITHVGLVINRDLMIEAGGGNSKTLNEEDASKQNAFIRIRPIHHRSDFVECYYPPYKVARVVV